MPGHLTELARLYRFNDTLLSIVAGEFGPQEWTWRPPGGGNPAIWNLGHIAYERRLLLRKLGESLPEDDWEKLFRRGAKLEDGSPYPSPASLIADFQLRGGSIFERLGSLGDEEADASWGGELPHGSATVTAGAHFLFMHECYHLGQIGLIGRMCGKAGIA